MIRGPLAKPVKLRARTVALRPGDFATLRQIAGGAMEIRTIEATYRRLRDQGLVTHKFEDRDGWPVALAQLTADGMEVLPLEAGASVMA